MAEELRLTVDGSLCVSYIDLPAIQPSQETITFLLVPGLLDLRAQYRFLAPLLHLQGQSRVIVTDLRGMGGSDVGFSSYTPLDTGRDTVAFIRQLGLKNVVLVGSSMAAASVLWAAADAPDAVRACVLLGPFAWDHPTGLLMTGLLKLLFLPCWAAANGASSHRSLYKDNAPQDVEEHVRKLRENLGQPGRVEAARGHVFSLKAPCAQRIPELVSRPAGGASLPVLAVYGDKDPDFPPEGGEGVQKEVDELRRLMPHAELMLVKGAGHYPHSEQPQAVADRLLAFAREAGKCCL